MIQSAFTPKEAEQLSARSPQDTFLASPYEDTVAKNRTVRSESRNPRLTGDAQLVDGQRGQFHENVRDGGKQ